jgi:hypothetical protein
MKRSGQVTLVLLTVAGLGAGAYALAPDSACRDPNAVRRDPPPDCRSSHGGSSGGGHGSSFFSSGSGNSGASSTANTTSTSRGGFGAIGRALSGGG